MYIKFCLRAVGLSADEHGGEKRILNVRYGSLEIADISSAVFSMNVTQCNKPEEGKYFPSAERNICKQLLFFSHSELVIISMVA